MRDFSSAGSWRCCKRQRTEGGYDGSGLAFTRYCHDQYCVVYIAITGGRGATLYWAILWTLGGEGGVPKQRVGAQRIVLICAQNPVNKTISCIGQALGRGCVPTWRIPIHLLLWRSHRNTNSVFRLVCPTYDMNTYIGNVNVFTKTGSIGMEYAYICPRSAYFRPHVGYGRTKRIRAGPVPN